MTKKPGLIVAFGAGLVVAIAVVVGFGWFGSSSENGESAIAAESSVDASNGKGRAEVAGASTQAEPFKVFILQSVDSNVELNRFTFPYADIAAKSDYASLVGVLSEIPGSRFGADTYTIFRTIDQVPVAFGKEVDALAGGNTGVLALPNEAVEALGGPVAAFKYYYEELRRLTD